MVNPRNAKLADQIKVILAETLERKVKDPRLGFVTLTEVRLTGDNREATAFYTVLGDDDERAIPQLQCEGVAGEVLLVSTPHPRHHAPETPRQVQFGDGASRYRIV